MAMRNVSSRMLIVILAVSVMAAIATPALAAKVTIKLALSVPDSALKQPQGSKAFKNYVEYRSGGDIEVKLFFAQFGGEREVAQQIQQGTLDMAVPSDGALAGFDKNIQVFSIPYLFPSSPVAWKFFEHPFAKKLAEDLRQKSGLRVLTYAENGFRNFTNNVREIRTPGDMKGLKMRTMESPVYMRLVQSLGAAATPISFAELIMSLQQKVVDGQENAIQDIYENGIADVQKYLSLDEHIFGLQFLVIGDKFFKGLSEHHKQIVMEGARVYASLANALQARSQGEYIEKIKAKGLKVYINTPEEKEQFRKLSQDPVKQFISQQIGAELVNGLLSAVEDSKKSLYDY
jgi:TRAP-type transport system periplasmic protein